MAQNHAIRLGRDLTFAVLQAGDAPRLRPTGVAAAEAETGIADLGGLMEGAFAQGPPIYGGSDQIQRNIVGERGWPTPSHAPTGACRSGPPKN